MEYLGGDVLSVESGVILYRTAGLHSIHHNLVKGGSDAGNSAALHRRVVQIMTCDNQNFFYRVRLTEDLTLQLNSSFSWTISSHNYRCNTGTVPYSIKNPNLSL